MSVVSIALCGLASSVLSMSHGKVFSMLLGLYAMTGLDGQHVPGLATIALAGVGAGITEVGLDSCVVPVAMRLRAFSTRLKRRVW